MDAIPLLNDVIGQIILCYVKSPASRDVRDGREPQTNQIESRGISMPNERIRSDDIRRMRHFNSQ
ncbi:UNVERIFIED_CONTAM: hypothetical protein NCL1_50321 [Trichonephila clavipes]